MSRLEAIKEYYIQTLDKWSVVLDKAILKFPDDKLEFKPTDISYTVAEMATHVYQMAFMYAYAVKYGEFKEKNFQEIPFRAEDAKSGRQIVDYARKVKKFVKGVILKLSTEDLEKDVSYGEFQEIGKSFGEVWGDWSMGAKVSLDKMMEDILHHRAQLFVYLRLLNLHPPFIYDYSPITVE
ncbi:MAG: DinB family protein [Candidatus Kariarchaeaceae archaeon]|jgi:uncharacterized damage-inducible protein DinB